MMQKRGLWRNTVYTNEEIWLWRMKCNWSDIGNTDYRLKEILYTKKYIGLCWLWRRNWLDIGEQTCCVSTALGLRPRLTCWQFFYIAFNVSLKKNIKTNKQNKQRNKYKSVKTDYILPWTLVWGKTYTKETNKQHFFLYCLQRLSEEKHKK